jgi:RNA polymerase sigma-70 factor, ECF subfamily
MVTRRNSRATIPEHLKHARVGSRIQGVHGSPSGQELTLTVPARPWRRAAGGRDEAVLIGQARNGSADAVETLVRRHWDAAHRTAFLIVQDSAAADDIAQEAILAAVRAIDGFDRKRPFRPWLHRIVVNRSLDWLRARHRRPEVSREPAGAEAPAPAEEMSDDLIAALGALDPEQRALVALRHVLGYRSSELAHMLGLPPATVRTRLARALHQLRSLLEGKDA